MIAETDWHTTTLYDTGNGSPFIKGPMTRKQTSEAFIKASVQLEMKPDQSNAFTVLLAVFEHMQAVENNNELDKGQEFTDILLRMGFYPENRHVVYHRVLDKGVLKLVIRSLMNAGPFAWNIQMRLIYRTFDEIA